MLKVVLNCSIIYTTLSELPTGVFEQADAQPSYDTATLC